MGCGIVRLAQAMLDQACVEYGVKACDSGAMEACFEAADAGRGWRSESELTYMTPVTLTTEFTPAPGGTR
jgi:hypothetical protein